MKKISRDSSAFISIHQQKREALQNLRKEKQLIKIYSTTLLSPLQKGNLKPQTPIKSLFNTLSTANYTFKLLKGVFSVFKLLH